VKHRNKVTVLGGLAAVALGILSGIGVFTFGYGEGSAYLRDDPASCANCHVMQGHLDSWVKSSHRSVATCNDCHLPHDFVGKWFTKGDNGLLHSVAFTIGGFPDPIQIKPRNRRVTQGACLHCHSTLVNDMLPPHSGGEVLLCAKCHADVGHSQR
jgi:cytochrome c nitrite reductase small subunit